MTPRQLAVVESVAGDQLEEFGYERASKPTTRAKVTSTTVRTWRRTGGRVASGVAGRVRRASPQRTGTA
jgi:hypothetical protein